LKLFDLDSSVVMSLGQNFFDPGWVRLAIFGLGLGLGLENFPPKSQIFQFFPLRVKKSGLVRSKSTWVKDGSLLFTTGQKYARAGQVASLIFSILKQI